MNNTQHEQPGEEPLHRRAASEVQERLSRLAVLHAVPDEHLEKAQAPNTHNFHDYTDETYLNLNRMHTAQHAPSKQRRFKLPWIRNPMKIPEWASEQPEGAEKTHMLQTIQSAISREAQAFHSDKKRVNWLATSHTLLEKAETAEEGNERNTLFVAAAMSAQFSPDESERLSFLEEVYNRGSQEAMAAACDTSHLVILTKKLPRQPRSHINVHSVKSLAPAFRLNSNDLNDYLRHIKAKPGQTTAEETPSPKSLQKQILSQAQEGTQHAATQARAQETGLRHEKVNQALIDPHKIERFALQQYFIKKQMAEVLGPDLTQTPLQNYLRRKRSSPKEVIDADSASGRVHSADARVNNELGILTDALREGFTELSAPVVQQFSPDHATTGDGDSLTFEQRSALRFRSIDQAIKGHVAITRYIAPEVFARRRNLEIITRFASRIPHDIWDVVVDGADAPESGVNLIGDIIKGALHNSSLGPVSAEELRDFAQANRQKLLRVATANVADFNSVDVKSKQTLVGRDKNGHLQLTGDFKLPSKEALDEYAAITLGCPALREIHENRALMKKDKRLALAHGSSNYLDHILAVIINEAYERGLFNLENYRTSYATAAQARAA